MSADAKILDEDAETGAKKYRYIRTGADHFSLAFTYAWMAAAEGVCFRMWIKSLQEPREHHRRDNPAESPGFFGGEDPTRIRNPMHDPRWW